MEKIFNKVNGFIPSLTALAVLFGFLSYMVAYFFIKGVGEGYGVSANIGTQQELIAQGLILSVGLIGKIAIQAFYSIIEQWHMLLVGAGIGICIVIFDVFIKKGADVGDLSEKAQTYSRYLVGLLIFIYIFIAFPLAAYNKGVATAQKVIENLNEKGCVIESNMWRKCSTITYKKSDVLITLNGLVVDKSGQEITIYLPKERVLRTFQLPNDAVIERNFVLD